MPRRDTTSNRWGHSAVLEVGRTGSMIWERSSAKHRIRAAPGDPFSGETVKCRTSALSEDCQAVASASTQQAKSQVIATGRMAKVELSDTAKEKLRNWS